MNMDKIEVKDYPQVISLLKDSEHKQWESMLNAIEMLAPTDVLAAFVERNLYLCDSNVIAEEFNDRYDL